MESMDRLLELGLGPSNNYQSMAREIWVCNQEVT